MYWRMLFIVYCFEGCCVRYCRGCWGRIALAWSRCGVILERYLKRYTLSRSFCATVAPSRQKTRGSRYVIFFSPLPKREKTTYTQYLSLSQHTPYQVYDIKFSTFFFFFFDKFAVQANVRKKAKISEAFDGVKKDENKRKYRAQGKDEERRKRAREGGRGRERKMARATDDGW